MPHSDIQILNDIFKSALVQSERSVLFERLGVHSGCVMGEKVNWYNDPDDDPDEVSHSLGSPCIFDPVAQKVLWTYTQDGTFFCQLNEPHKLIRSYVILQNGTEIDLPLS